MVAVGVSGHRVLAELGRIEAGLGQVIGRMGVAFPSGWTVVCSLAEGADRLVTWRLLARGGSRLVAVLPLRRDDYEGDFATAASRREFRDLLGRAAEVVEVAPQRDRDDAYEAAGRAVLDRSDVLIAVWDGREAQGKGGTGGVVAEARRRGLPVAWIRAGNRRPETLEPVSLGVGQGAVTFERFPAVPGTAGTGSGGGRGR
jgi:hypothetical protein